jgi:putative transposase
MDATAQLVTDALVMGIWRRGKPDALLHHPDLRQPIHQRAFLRLMADHGVVYSMNRSGSVWDDAAVESFFSSLKTERTAHKMYRSRDEAKADLFDYIERFYNPKRRHSTIGFFEPCAVREAGWINIRGVNRTRCRPEDCVVSFGSLLPRLGPIRKMRQPGRQDLHAVEPAGTPMAAPHVSRILGLIDQRRTLDDYSWRPCLSLFPSLNFPQYLELYPEL